MRDQFIRLLCSATILIGASTAEALDPAIISPDVTVDLGGTIFNDHDMAADNQTGTVVAVALGVFPVRSDVDAYHFAGGSIHYYSLDTATDLGGGLTVAPADVVEFDGITDTVIFDAASVFATAGINGAGINVDAVTVHSSGDLLLSFDNTIDLAGVVANDEDLVRFDGVTTFTIEFEGSLPAIGVDPALDLDGAQYQTSDGHLFLSFDGSGSVGGVDFDDDDILEFDPVGPTWTMYYNGSALHAGLAAADIIAVPEPDQLLQLAPGILLLTVLALRRKHL